MRVVTSPHPEHLHANAAFYLRRRRFASGGETASASIAWNRSFGWSVWQTFSKPRLTQEAKKNTKRTSSDRDKHLDPVPSFKIKASTSNLIHSSYGNSLILAYMDSLQHVSSLKKKRSFLKVNVVNV